LYVNVLSLNDQRTHPYIKQEWTNTVSYYKTRPLLLSGL